MKVLALQNTQFTDYDFAVQDYAVTDEKEKQSSSTGSETPTDSDAAKNFDDESSTNTTSQCQKEHEVKFTKHRLITS